MKNKYYLNNKYWIQHTILLSKMGKKKKEIPIGAVLMLNNKIISESYNKSMKKTDPTAHAEIMTMKTASKKMNNYRLLKTKLYVTLEPCMMCFGAMMMSSMKNLMYGLKKKNNYYLLINLWNKKKMYKKYMKNKICLKMLKNFFINYSKKIFKNKKYMS